MYLQRISWLSSVLLFVTLLFGRDFERPITVAPPQGIVTDGDYSVETLVRDIFIAGACDNVTNIQAIGDARGIGYFENGANGIGLERGIILATGDISNASGPNNVTDRSGNFFDSSTDPHLGALATGALKDVVGLSFDFTPLDTLVTFSYVFASEEYCEFAGSIYNDVFGFFVSGPGINGPYAGGAINVALLPGTNEEVSINTINHQQNAAYYRHNELYPDMAECGISPYPTVVHQEVEYDGFTQRLTATLRLSPCDSYHIRFVIADVADNFYDSAVFLEAGSFNIGEAVTLAAVNSSSEPALEGCGDAFFRFERANGESTGFPLSVNYKVLPSSSAQSGVDFAPLSGSVTIPVGSTSVLLPVEVINDGIPEPSEHLSIELDIPCACYTDSAKLYLADSPPLIIDLPEIAVCENGTNELIPSIISGTPPLGYAWFDGTSGQGAVVTAADTATLLTLSAVDACGNEAADTTVMQITQPPTALLTGGGRVCAGDTAWLSLELTGQPPWSVDYKVDGVVQPTLTDIWNLENQFPAFQDGWHELTQVGDAACWGTGQGGAQIDLTTLLVESQVEGVSCFGDQDGWLSVSLAGGTSPYQHIWQGYPSDSLVLEHLPAGTYELWVADAEGCEDWFELLIEEPEPLDMAMPDCPALAANQLEVEAVGGTPPYLYSTDGIAFEDSGLFDRLEGGDVYSLHLQDANGCELVGDFTVPVPYDGDMVQFPSLINYTIGSQVQFSPILQVPEHLITSVRWLPAEGLSCADCLEPYLLVTQPTSYTLWVTDIYGCSYSTTVTVELDDRLLAYAPTAFSPNGDEVNDRFTLFANTYQVVRVASMTIFDRWGGTLFEGADFPPNEPTMGWDGYCKGLRMGAGMYVYTAELLLYDGSTRRMSGHFFLVD